MILHIYLNILCSYIIKIMSGIREKNAQTIIIQKKIIIYLLISGERALNLKCKFFIFKINSSPLFIKYNIFKGNDFEHFFYCVYILWSWLAFYKHIFNLIIEAYKKMWIKTVITIQRLIKLFFCCCYSSLNVKLA